MTINCKGNLIDLQSPKIMGILNLTPDSFYDGGKYKDFDNALKQVERMILEGADFIDIGAYSSRPGADHISEEEELARIVPIVESLVKTFPKAILSIDTFRSRVALRCIEAGAALINDISAGNLDPKILEIVGRFPVPYIMMHMKGTPQNMVNLNTYEDMVKEIQFYFSEKVKLAKANGINDIILDPGFGFAKNIEQNFELLKKLSVFNLQNLPILAGLSRKSLIYKTLKIKPEKALNGTTFLNALALHNGANILRVHDVHEAVECVTLYKQYETA